MASLFRSFSHSVCLVVNFLILNPGLVSGMDLAYLKNCILYKIIVFALLIAQPL